MDESMRYTSYSRNDERFPYATSGSFYCKRRNEDRNTVIIIFASAFLLALSWFFWWWASWGVIISVIIMMVYTVAIVLLNVYVLTYYRLCGEEYTYKADSDKFIITAPKGTARITVIKYADVENVLYCPTYYKKNKQRGYDVIIKTKTATYKYEYIFSFFKQVNTKKKVHKDTRELPFFIIEERSGLVKKPDLLTYAEKYDM